MGDFWAFTPPTRPYSVAIGVGVLLTLIAVIAKYAYDDHDAWTDWTLGGGLIIALFGGLGAFNEGRARVRAAGSHAATAA